MKMNEELQIVLSTYASAKGRMWSKTAKRILGVHLFGNRSLTSGWEATFRHWWDEVDWIESRYGYVPTLDAAKLPMGEFFECVMTTLHARGYVTSDEHKRMADSMNANRRSVFRPHDSYAQAMAVKTFFEASMPRRIGSFTKHSFRIYSELFNQPLGAMLEGRVEPQEELDERPMKR